MPAGRQSGFTLIEVMLAVAITAFVAVLSYQGLSASISAQQRYEEQVTRLANIQLALTVLERDLRQAAPRSIRDAYRDWQPALSGGALEDYPLRVTRRGWQNPHDFPRSDLQRVRYRLEDETLIREHWGVLDRASEDETLQELVLIEGVDHFELAFVSSEASDPLDHWPPQGADRDLLPVAVEVTIDLQGLGEIKRVFEIPVPQVSASGGGGEEDQ